MLFRSVDIDRVDDRIVSAKVVHERPVRARPLLDIVPSCRARRKAVLGRVNRERPDRLVVVRERRHRLARCEVPEAANAG